MSTAEAQIGLNTNLQQQDLKNLVNVYGKCQRKKATPNNNCLQQRGEKVKKKLEISFEKMPTKYGICCFCVPKGCE